MDIHYEVYADVRNIHLEWNMIFLPKLEGNEEMTVLSYTTVQRYPFSSRKAV